MKTTQNIMNMPEKIEKDKKNNASHFGDKDKK